jgi:uncharacterized OB-fold protein
MRREILGYRCRQCGHVHYPYRSRCRQCGETVFDGHDIVFDHVPLPREGVLITFTDVYALPPEFEVPKLSLGIVELEGGTRITGQLRIARPTAGMKVHGEIEVVREGGYTKHHGMVFYAASEERKPGE